MAAANPAQGRRRGTARRPRLRASVRGGSWVHHACDARPWDRPVWSCQTLSDPLRMPWVISLGRAGPACRAWPLRTLRSSGASSTFDDVAAAGGGRHDSSARGRVDAAQHRFWASRRSARWPPPSPPRSVSRACDRRSIPARRCSAHHGGQPEGPAGPGLATRVSLSQGVSTLVRN